MLLKKLTRYEREVVDFALLFFFPLLLSLNFVIQLFLVVEKHEFVFEDL